VDAYPHPHEDALIAGLRTLRPLGLARSKRLQDDLVKLRHVCGVTGQEGRSEVVERWVARMEDEVRERPHLLVAYAFTLYLAVLSGGRHIRSELSKAGLPFWTGTTADEVTNTAQATTEKKPASSWNWRSPVARLTSSKPTPPSPSATLDTAPHSRKPRSAADLAAFEPNGLSFWFFPGASDGEDLRAKFKANLAELQNYISPSQEDEIVAEAQAIFSRIEALVGELDLAVAAGARAEAQSTAEDEALDAALDEVRFEKPQLVAVPLGSPALPPAVLRDASGLAVPAWVGLAVVMCGVSYAAWVSSHVWTGH
jgi:heme oxygenase